MVPMPSHVATIAAAFYLLGTIRKRQRKKPWLERRRLRHSNAMNLLESDELTGFIDRESFDQLLKMVQPFMTKTDSIMSQSISPEERLIATLLFLATGQGYQTIKDSMLICPQLLAKIIPETCSVIYSALSSYIKLPSTVKEWKEIAKSFEQKWQFNNCVGCLDARHILIKKPSASDSSDFINHEGTHSVICVAAVNANYEFIYIESGLTGNFSNTLLPQNMKFFEYVVEDDQNLPEPYPLPGLNKSVPYVFIGDGFWPVNTNIMSPYLGEELTDTQKIFNYRLRRANTAGNAFGILKANFHVFDEALHLEVEAVNKLVLAACSLHNFLIKKTCYVIPDMVDREDTANGRYFLGECREIADPFMPVKRVNRKPWNNGEQVRNDLTEYFNTTGSVPFQDKMMNVVPCTEPLASDNEEWPKNDYV